MYIHVVTSFVESGVLNEYYTDSVHVHRLRHVICHVSRGGHTYGCDWGHNSLVPRPTSAFRRLQYRKTGKSWENLSCE